MSCIKKNLICSQITDSQNTLENRRENQDDVTLDDIVRDLLSFFNGFQCLHGKKTKIDTCDIKRGRGGCWSADDIKEAWKETRKLDIKSSKRQHRACVIMLQVLKRCLYNGGFNRLEEQSDLKEVETSPKLSEEAEITPSETEQGPSEITSEIPSSSETEQEPSEITSEKPPGGEKKVMVQPHSEPSVQLPNRKRSQDCHTSERNNEENFPSKQTFVKTDGFQRLEKMNDGTWTRGLNESSGTVYIRIPLSVMSGDESSCKPEKVKNDNPTYKLIDSVPYFTEIRKKKSYAMLYDNRTRNAAWVYEILNKSTLKKEKDFDRVPFEVDNSIHPFFQTPDVSKLHSNTHHKGHLAAAANHRWCKKAFDDTNVFSNITIQDSNLNTSEWKDFENHLRHKIENNENIRNLHVYTGPLYEPNGTKVSYLMKYDKAVPTHYFKVVIEENMDDTVKLESYVVPNQGITVDLQKWKRPINYIEQVSGLIFTESLSNQGRRDIERTVTWHGKNQDGEECKVISKVKVNVKDYHGNVKVTCRYSR